MGFDTGSTVVLGVVGVLVALVGAVKLVRRRGSARRALADVLLGVGVAAGAAGMAGYAGPLVSNTGFALIVVGWLLLARNAAGAPDGRSTADSGASRR